jgi:hypothetical protein
MNVSGGPKLRGHGRHCGHDEAEWDAAATATATTAPHVPPGARDESSPGLGGNGAHGGPMSPRNA